MRLILTFLCWGLSAFMLNGQTLSGMVTDAGGAMGDVVITNVYTAMSVTTDPLGKFSISGGVGQLIEFHKIGYKTARLRVVANNIPYYRITMDPGVQELDEVEVRNHYQDFKHDSLRYHALFKKELEFPKMSTLQSIESPFSALSKKNRQLWAFQKEYAWFEQQKYVDYNFNEKLVSNLTGLQGDSAQAYMRRFRPSYEMVRSMKEYEYFSYIKQTVEMWRKRQRYGGDHSRGGG